MRKLLVLGCGSIGRRHMGNFKAAGVPHICGVDTRADRLEQATNQFGLAGVYRSLEEAFEAGSFDAVVIATPPHVHNEQALAAAEHGCHIFMEKPVADSFEGLAEVERVCREKGLVFLVAYCHRFIPYALRAKEMLDAGAIGRPLAARALWGSYLPDWHPWEDYRTFYMARKEQGGGALLDESHGLDLLRWFLGEVTSVQAMVDHVSDLEITSDDVAALLLRFESGVVASAYFDLLNRTPRLEIEVVGSTGTLIFDRMRHELRLYSAESKRWEIYPFTQMDMLSMYPKEVEHFLTCVREGTQPLIDLADGRRTLQVCLAAFESSATGRAVPVGTAVAATA